MRNVKGTSLCRKDQNTNNNRKEKNSHFGKGKHLVKAVYQPTIKLVQKLKGRSRKIVCNYNIKLRDTHTRSKKKNDKNKHGEGE